MMNDVTAASSKVIVTKAVSQEAPAVYTKDRAIRTVVGNKGMLVVPKGTLAVLDLKTLTTLDESNIAAAKGNINIGVSIGKEMRWLQGIKGFNPKDVEGASVSAPKCAVVPIYDNFFKCSTCYQSYAVAVEIFDEYSMMGNIGETYDASVTPDCTGCEPDCNQDTNCQAIVDLLVPALNAEFAENKVQKAYATPIYANDSFWCFDVDEDGNLTVPVTTFTINGTTVSLDAPITTKDQLVNLAAEINIQIESDSGVKGTATLTGLNQYGSTCKPNILVNTDATDFAIAGYTACDTGSPIGDRTDECGWRVIVDLPSFGCDCEVQGLDGYLGRFAKIYNISGFEDLTTEVVQEMELPANFGAYIQLMEYKQELGGEGRAYAYEDMMNTNGFIQFSDISRNKAAISNSDCNKDYVVFELNLRTNHISDKPFNDNYNGLSPNGYIAVEKDDTVTLTKIQDIINAIADIAGFDHIDYAGAITDQFKGENK